MTTERTGPSGSQSHSQALQRTTNTLTTQPGASGFDFEDHTYTQSASEDEPILVHFNGHFNGEFNGTFILPNTTYNRSQGDSDAVIAARKAMTKRSSRSYAARISRTRSRKNEIFKRPTKPGITLDTSFSRHRGNAPRQVFPHENDVKSSGTVKKHNWLGLGRSATKNKGLGISQGTPQPELRSDTAAPPTTAPHRTDEKNAPYEGADGLDPKSATPGSRTWQEVSPWDRAIPIGISVPSDSVPDFSPYQSTRQRSGSDATLVTPSIIITPAGAMKSVWSPDTASDYTGRSSSIYSRFTFNARTDDANVPPVPALPVDVQKTSIGNSNAEFYHGVVGGNQTHIRNDTLDSAGTAFEDDEDDIKMRDRITSTATFFEEDETPLRNKDALSPLSIDTYVVPTPRRSQGWWNVITTPFQISRTNSVWTQGGRNTEKTPSIPMMPQRFDPNTASPSTPSTYIWSATEKSPSIRGASPLGPTSYSTIVPTPNPSERIQSEHVEYGFNAKTPPTSRSQVGVNDSGKGSIDGNSSMAHRGPQVQSQQIPSTPDRNIASPLSAMSPSPIIDTATTGTVVMPRQVAGSHPIHVVIELQDKRADASVQPAINHTAPSQHQIVNINFQDRQLDSSFQTSNNDTAPNTQAYQSKPGHHGRQLDARVEATSASNAPNHHPYDDSELQDRRPARSMQSMDTNAPPIVQPLYAKIEPQDRRPDGSIRSTSANTLAFGQPFSANEEHPDKRSEASVRATNTSTTLPVAIQPLFVGAKQQDKRSETSFHTRNANTTSPRQPGDASPPTPQLFNVDLSTPRGRASPHDLPVFAPPPTFAKSSSRGAFGHGSRASSPASTLELKGQKQHRKVRSIMDRFPFLKRFKKKREQEKKEEKEKKKRSGWCFWCCGCCLILLVLLAIIIPVTVVVTRKHNNGSKGADPPSQWLNLTGYPPMPTGISTIAQPEAIVEQSGCVVPATQWSCALPKEQQQSISPNKPDQPNFKLEITFQNGTVVDPAKTQLSRRAVNPVTAGALIRSKFLRHRDVPSPSPAPPSTDDMKFLGEKTDGNVAPFEGEETPFFITFEDTTSTISSRLAKRADSSDPTNITTVIPPPSLNPDGTAAPANLYPLPSAEPLRLFNRGKANEHLGFYVYYDRSIFLKNISSSTGRGGNPADVDGGSPFDAANFRCTFTQTRFLVQIWTKSQATKPLLQGSASNATDAVFKRPGTFPYPVTVTLDRHGGAPAKKNAFCYAMQSDGSINNDAKSQFFIFEDRGFGGVLVNPTQGKNVTTGLIDGGSGGCSCQWQNWLS